MDELKSVSDGNSNESSTARSSQNSHSMTERKKNIDATAADSHDSITRKVTRESHRYGNATTELQSNIEPKAANVLLVVTESQPGVPPDAAGHPNVQPGRAIQCDYCGFINTRNAQQCAQCAWFPQD